VFESSPYGRGTGTLDCRGIFVEVVSKTLLRGQKFPAGHTPLDGSDWTNLAAGRAHFTATLWAVDEVKPMLDLFWTPNLLVQAVRGCTAVVFQSWGLLLLAVGFGILAGRRVRMGWTFFPGILVFASVAWWLRDRLFLLADSRLWVHTTESFGTQVPLYRAPLSAKVMGQVTGALENWVGAAESLAILSVAAGVITAIALWLGMREKNPGSRSLGPFLALAWIFGQPMGFVFYGHIETYPFAAAILALVLAAARKDFQTQRVRLITLILFLMLVFAHALSIFLLIPVLALLWARQRPGLGVLRSYVLLLLPFGLAAVAVPEFRSHLTLFQGFSIPELGRYTADIANGWILCLLSPAVILFGGRRFSEMDGYGKFLGLTAFTFLILPFFASFDLGIYRDLDIFTPGFVALTFLAVHEISLRPVSTRRIAVSLGAGSLFLGAFLSLSICPQGGIPVLEAHLSRATMTEGGRSYGYEVLAYYYREKNNLARAEENMHAALQVTPGNHRLWGPVGEFQLARGDTAEAIVSLTKSMATPRAPKTAPLLGELLIRTGHPETAMEILEPRRALLITDAQAAAALAVAYFRVGLPESTIAVSRERLAIAGDDDIAFFNLASGLSATNQGEDAERMLRQAIALAPEKVSYHRSLVRVLLSLPGGHNRATEYLEQLPKPLAEEIYRGL